MACINCLYEKVCNRREEIVEATSVFIMKIPNDSSITGQSVNRNSKVNKLVEELCCMHESSEPIDLSPNLSDSEPDYRETCKHIF